jgi:hypothetical protein
MLEPTTVTIKEHPFVLRLPGTLMPPRACPVFPFCGTTSKRSRRGPGGGPKAGLADAIGATPLLLAADPGHNVLSVTSHPQ